MLSASQTRAQILSRERPTERGAAKACDARPRGLRCAGTPDTQADCSAAAATFDSDRQPRSVQANKPERLYRREEGVRVGEGG